MRVSFSVYEDFGEEKIVHEDMPHFPSLGDTVHLTLTGNQDDSKAYHVFNVSHAKDEFGLWRAEIAVR